MSYTENDPVAVAEALRVLIAPGSVFEIRALHQNHWRGLIGYFDDPDTAAEAVSDITEGYSGIYVTLNPVKPECLYRSNNCFTRFTKDMGTRDADITGRNWLPIDIDPVRPSGISSTDAEHKLALKLANTIASTLELCHGFPYPVFASSGNGAHLLYPITLDNDKTARDTIKEALRTLALTYDSAKVKVDTSVFNAARIWRLYGTVARKGENAIERPHRRSVIIDAPDERLPLSQLLLRTLAKADLPAIVKSKTAAYPSDEQRWRLLNQAALKQLSDWVPLAFGDDAREYLDGYRVSSEALNRDLEEDLSFQPLPIGIVDFGEHDSGEAQEGHRTPISVLAEFVHDSKEEAAIWLAEAISEKASEFEGIATKYSRKEQFLEDDDDPDTDDRVKGFSLDLARTAVTVEKKVHAELKYLVSGLLPRGAYCLISRPKMGKSWLTLQLAMAMAKGGHFLGFKVEKSKVLLLSLEEKERRLQKRMRALNGGKSPDAADLENLIVIALDVLVDAPFPRGEDGCKVLRALILRHGITLIIIDTFSLFRDHDGDYGGSVYDRDYAAVMPLVRLASELEISIIAVHHERKGATTIGRTETDFMEAANGSAGLTAAFEGCMRIEGVRTEEPDDDDDNDEIEEKDEVIAIPKQPRKLKISGRDIEKDVITMNIQFDTKQGGWHRSGKQNVENAIIAAIRGAIQLTWTDLCQILPSLAKNEIKRKLAEMVNENILVRENYNYKLEYAGEAADVDEDLLDGAADCKEMVLRLINWRGTTPTSFLYEAMAKTEYTPSSIRSAAGTLINRREIKAINRGEYIITKKGLFRLKQTATGLDDAEDLC